MHTTRPVEFGISLREAANVAAEAQTAEARGFDYFAAGEHVFFHGAVDNSLIALSAAAGATRRIKLFSTIVLAPLYPAALLAKQVTTLDRVANGRFHLGVGIGGEFRAEFDACGVPLTERAARTDEALEILRRLWTEERVSFAGRYATLTDVSLLPRPIAAPHPPIWVAGRRDAAMRRCARYANGWLPYMITPQRLARGLETIASKARAIGRRQAINGGVHLAVTVHDKRERALQMALQHLGAEYRQDFSSLVPKYAVVGRPGDCVDRLREYVAAGAGTIVLQSACPADYAETNENLLAEHVLPHFNRPVPSA